jgi:multicomponent Na+:H+ antiporter subunit C
MTVALPYIVAAFALFGLGLGGMLLSPGALRKLIAANVMGLGALMLLIAFAWRPDGPPDPTPHALVITGIVVAVAATALGLAMIVRAEEADAEKEAEEGATARAAQAVEPARDPSSQRPDRAGAPAPR